MAPLPPNPLPARPSPPGPDGLIRPAESERHLNELAVKTFAGEPGKAFLDYLRAITVNAVCGPEIAANALFHREGMRFLVGIIEQRIKLGLTPHVEQPKPQSRTSRTGTVARRSSRSGSDQT